MNEFEKRLCEKIKKCNMFDGDVKVIFLKDRLELLIFVDNNSFKGTTTEMHDILDTVVYEEDILTYRVLFDAKRRLS